MNLKYGQFDILERELEKLSPLHQVAFSAACCERLYPHLDIFVREIRKEGWDEENFFRAALDVIWQFLAAGEVDAARVRQLISDCEDNYPHEYESEDTPESQRSADAIDSTLILCLEPTPKQTISVAKQVDETLFEYINYLYENEDDSWENKSHQEMLGAIASHPFTVREMGKQSSDLQRLQSTPALTPEFLHWLRTSSENGGKSLLDLS
ncbi:MAG: DUF416 family protein [Nostoc sp.]|uniref:DUF416 family protein n=1 Tax=Nostoc sp. TaxID=1180 RepID=UPI002FF8A8E8